MRSYVQVIRLGEIVMNVEIEGPVSVYEVLDKAAVAIDKLRMDIRVNGKSADMTFQVKAGDVITVLPPIRGGLD